VSAKDRATGKENNTTVEKSGGLSKEEVEKMKRDAEMHAADDKKRREVIDLKNQGESLAYQTEKMLKDNGDKVSGGTRGEIESALNQLRENLKGEDGGAIKKSMDNLQAISHKLAEEMYKAGGPTPGGEGSPAPEAQTDRATKKDEDVIDAEYEVKKD
jgi:molecular chaperone DnaK